MLLVRRRSASVLIRCRVAQFLDQGGGASAAAAERARGGRAALWADPLRRAGRTTGISRFDSPVGVDLRSFPPYGLRFGDAPQRCQDRALDLQ